jgi:hypothetical protein
MKVSSFGYREVLKLHQVDVCRSLQSIRHKSILSGYWHPTVSNVLIVLVYAAYRLLPINLGKGVEMTLTKKKKDVYGNSNLPTGDTECIST